MRANKCIGKRVVKAIDGLKITLDDSDGMQAGDRIVAPCGQLYVGATVYVYRDDPEGLERS